MENAKKHKYLVLFISSIILCLFRYALLLPTENYLLKMLKSVLEKPQVYYLDIVTIVIIVINTVLIFKAKDKGKLIYWTEALAFTAALPVLKYLLWVYQWILKGGWGSPKEIWEMIKYFSANFLFGLFIFLLVMAVITAIINKKKVVKLVSNLLQKLKENVIRQFVLVLFIIHFIRFGYYFFRKDNMEASLSMTSLNAMNMVFIIAFIIALLIIIFRSREKGQRFPLAAWLGILLCLFGMIPMFANINTIMKFCIHYWEAVVFIAIIIIVCIFLWFLKYDGILEMLQENSKSLFLIVSITPIVSAILIYVIGKIIQFIHNDGLSKCYRIIFQIFLLCVVSIILFGIIVLLIKFIQYFMNSKEKILNKFKELWKINKNKISIGDSLAFFFYSIICMIMIIGTIMVFINWTSISHGFIGKNQDAMEVLLQILGVLLSIVILVLMVMFILYQLGVFLIRTLQETRELKGKNKKKFYLSHGSGGLLALIFSYISWYLYTKLEPNEETILGIAGNVFSYFALPVVFMIWYSIAFWIMDAIWDPDDKRSIHVVKLIKKYIYELTESFITSIFSPLRLLLSYFDILCEAILDDKPSKKLVLLLTKAEKIKEKEKHKFRYISKNNKKGRKNNEE